MSSIYGRQLWENDSFLRFTVLPVECRRPGPTVFHGRLWGRCRSRMRMTPASQRENPKEIRAAFRHTVLQNRSSHRCLILWNLTHLKHNTTRYTKNSGTISMAQFREKQPDMFFHPRRVIPSRFTLCSHQLHTHYFRRQFLENKLVTMWVWILYTSRMVITHILNKSDGLKLVIGRYRASQKI